MYRAFRIKLTGFERNVTDSALWRFEDFGNELKNVVGKRGTLDLSKSKSDDAIFVVKVGRRNAAKLQQAIQALLNRYHLHDEVKMEQFDSE